MNSNMTSVSETTKDWAGQRGFIVKHSAETTSTNDDAKANSTDESESFVLYTTEHQTAGRGRGENTWLDTGAGECLLSSWSYKMDSAPQPITGPRIGLALYNAAHGTWPSLPWSLKAPNDLYLDGLKVAGLLIESVSKGSQHRIVIGLGMNVLNHPRRFNEAVHLSSSLNVAPEEGEWFQFLDELHSELSQAIGEITAGTLSEFVRGDLAQALNANSNKTYTVQEVSPQGDLIHDGGKIKWTEL